MKQIIVFMLIFSFLFIPAGFLRAQTNEDIAASLQEQLVILLKRVLDLQMQLMALLQQQAGEQENMQETLKEQIIQEVKEGIKEEEKQKERERIEEEEKKEREQIMAELDEIPGFTYNPELSTEQLKNMLNEEKERRQSMLENQCRTKGDGWVFEEDECVYKEKPPCLNNSRPEWNGATWICPYPFPQGRGLFPALPSRIGF
ncbi:MAG: hypothetical protein PHI88_03740 [Candidatus Pacebacteria bacterium]|nr:hypothetical protein [Candidatus Paceibacterota bacterium]